MKKLSITALLIVSLFAAAPAARAADWSNGEISCDLNVTALSWLAIWNWGKWDTFTVKFYKNKSPEKAVTFTCRPSTSIDSTGFGCFLPDNQIKTAVFDLNLNISVLATIKPGTSKSAACEILFKAAQ